MKREITITIGGRAGAGKTTLARYIATDLALRYGVAVTLIDDACVGPVPNVHEPLPSHFNASVTIDVKEKP